MGGNAAKPVSLLYHKSNLSQGHVPAKVKVHFLLSGSPGGCGPGGGGGRGGSGGRERVLDAHRSPSSHTVTQGSHLKNLLSEKVLQVEYNKTKRNEQEMDVRAASVPPRLMHPEPLPVPGEHLLAVTKERSIPFMFHECTPFHRPQRIPAGRSPRPAVRGPSRGHRAARAGSKLRESISQVGRRGEPLKGGSWVPAVQEPHPAQGELPLLPIPTPASPLPVAMTTGFLPTSPN